VNTAASNVSLQRTQQGVIKLACASLSPQLAFYALQQESVHVLAVIHAALDPVYIAGRLRA
jgi:hypothetical protein